jgi:hypothetical protein
VPERPRRRLGATLATETPLLFKGAGMLDFAGRDLQFLRLGFTYHDEDELTEAALRMARSLKW